MFFLLAFVPSAYSAKSNDGNECVPDEDYPKLANTYQYSWYISVHWTIKPAALWSASKVTSYVRTLDQNGGVVKDSPVEVIGNFAPQSVIVAKKGGEVSYQSVNTICYFKHPQKKDPDILEVEDSAIVDF